MRQAQQHLSRLRTPKLHASAADSIDVQHSNTNTLTSHADLDDVLQQARHLGFEAKIHIDRSHLSEPHEPLSNQSAATGTDAASDEVTELKLGTDAHQPQLQLTQSAEPQSTESAQNLTELVKLLTAHGLNLSGSPQEQSQHARMDATSLHQDSSAQHTTQLLDEVDETQSGDVSISIPLGHLSQTAAAELSLIHQTSQNLAISDRAENATHFLDPLLTNATVPAARTAGSAAHALPADSIDAHHEASHLHDAQQAMPPGLHHHADTDSDAQPSVSPGLEQPQVQPTGANSGVNNGTQQHMHDAVAFSSVFSGTEQALLQLTTPAATSTKQQQQQGEVTTDSASNGTEVQLQQLGNDEGDPSVNYSPEMAVVEPAEPIASDIHKEEEAHKAVAPLLVQHANETGSHKLTK